MWLEGQTEVFRGYVCPQTNSLSLCICINAHVSMGIRVCMWTHVSACVCSNPWETLCVCMDLQECAECV